MAEIVVSAVITVLCEKLISNDLLKLARSEGIDSQLKKWKKTLPIIHAVLADAGQKQIKESSVRLWLNELQDLAYDIDDVIDDLATEALRRKLNHSHHASTSTSKVFKFIPTCCTNFTPHNMIYGRKMSSKLDEITTKLDGLVELKDGLGLNVHATVERLDRTERWWDKTSAIEESKVMGREGDKEALLEKLLGGDENVTVLSIVGMGGIGKTTLAKVLYNEDKVKDHFELRAWVCVSDEMDVTNISNTIYEAVSGEIKRFSSLDLLHTALREKLSKKRFLLVLDDVWNEDHEKWELLRSPLVGAPGSKFVVTTRNTRVAEVMGSNEAYDLKVLSNKDALSLFAEYALGENNFDNHPSLKLLGEGFVQKCDRLPLALKTVGRVLKGNRDGDKWEELLSSEIWDIEDRKILPALRLSYHHLPPHLKHLFAYCALFPKDYVFYKERLVLLWVAEGFLSQSKGNKTMESLGNDYFEELKSRSFFQLLADDELPNTYRGYMGYKMHDLVNDLATSVAGEFFYRLDEEMDVSMKNRTYEKFRHFSLIGPRCGSYKKLDELKRARRMGTFLLLTSVGDENGLLHKTFLLTSVNDERDDGLLDRNLVELIPRLELLRVLSLTSLRITKVPPSISNLKHLRYVNFSYTLITCLPEEVSDLYNLQSLLVRSCSKLSGLPENFGKLINLRHLDTTDTPKLNKMPSGIGGLTSLQTLSKVIIAGGNGFNISELKGLSNLNGKLSIMGLEKVIDPVQAKDANLHQKKGLDVLEMEWSDVFDDSRDARNEFQVLEGLKPHHKLKYLNISFYKGATFPDWVGDQSFDQLTELRLCGCRSTDFPTLGHLQSLKKLYVEGMNEVKTLDFASHGIAFPSLELLQFVDMQCWQRWSAIGRDGDGTAASFPRLREIYIIRCPKLAEVSIGLIPSLRVLHLTTCSEALLKGMAGVFSSLVELEMEEVEGLTQLSREHVMNLGAVKHLCIDRCDDLLHLWEPEVETCKILVSLEKLVVWRCKKLVSLGEKEVNWESLKEVKLWYCDTLQSYNCPNSVKSLEIFACPSITSLTFSTVQELPSTLTDSVISDSDNIRPAPEKGTGLLPLFRLTSLIITNCKNLESFPHEHFQSFTSLEELRIFNCPSMDSSFPCGLWPPNLRILEIGGLKKPMSEWGFQNYPTSLVHLFLMGDNSEVVSFAVAEDERNATASSSFLLPPSLTSLKLYFFSEVESLSEVLQHLQCLKLLEIYKCRKIEDQLERMSVPSSLEVRVHKVCHRLPNILVSYISTECLVY